MQTKTHLSYSSISTFNRCPKQFELSRATKAPSTAAMSAGSETHAKLAADLKANAAKPSVGGKKLEAFFRYTLPGVTGVEEKIEIDLMGQKYVGYIDAYLEIGKLIKIVDWKSYRSNFVDEMQLKIYALGLLEKYPQAEMFECYFFYVNQDAYDKFEFWREDIEAFENQLYDLAQKIAATKTFEPCPGSHCSYCQYTTDCPAAKSLQIIECATPAGAKEMASKLFATEALVDQVRDVLKNYMIDNGLDEIVVSEKDRYYLQTSAPSLKTGKVKTEKAEKSTSARVKKIKEATEKKGEGEAANG